MTRSEDHFAAERRIGVAYGLAAFLSWGFIALYFKAVSSVTPMEVMAHRIVWSGVLLVAWLASRGRFGELTSALRTPRVLRVLAITAALIFFNWFVFIWAVSNGHVLQCSLGYFINPLVNVLLGVVVLKERLRRVQIISVALAVVGVAALAVGTGQVPGIALGLALSFGTYGLLRKTVNAAGVVGLAAETLLLMPLALGYLALLASRDALQFGDQAQMSWLLAAGGVVTALPLVWFANAARRLRYATVGFLQYIAPSLQFMLAVTAFGESFTSAHALSFGLIWSALGLYSWDVWRSR